MGMGIRRYVLFPLVVVRNLFVIIVLQYSMESHTDELCKSLKLTEKPKL